MKWLPLLVTALWIFAVGIIIPVAMYGDMYALFWPDMCVSNSDFQHKILKGIITTFIYVPSGIVIVMYAAIFVVVRRSSSRVQAMSKQGKVGNQGNTVKQGKKERKNIKMALVLFLLFFTFFIAFVPFCTYYFVQNYMSAATKKAYFLFSVYTAYSVSAFNPILYAFTFKPIKDAYTALLCKTCLKKKTKVMDFTISTVA